LDTATVVGTSDYSLYSLTHSLALDNGGELPGCFSISFAADKFDIELYTTDDADVGTYNLVMTSTVTLV
jgi:hypothetical protein